jgi:WD40 repeat protein
LEEGTIRLWDACTGAEVAVLTGQAYVGVNACAFSPDGRTLASASTDKTVRLWDAHTGEKITVLTGHTHSVDSCTFSPDGRILASASDDGTLRLWGTRTGKTVAAFPHHGSVGSCVFNTQGTRLAAGDTGGNVYILEFVGREIKPIILTPKKQNGRLIVRCPTCQQDHPLGQEQLGSELSCPTTSCGLQLKINPFFTQMA